MKKTEFLQMVLQEADHLREHATDEEKGKLDFSKLQITEAQHCIYGQMTGVCDSLRAFELYGKLFDGHGGGYETFSQLLHDGVFNPADEKEFALTPIEVYITMKGSKNKSLISYIKGEINEWKP